MQTRFTVSFETHSKLLSWFLSYIIININQYYSVSSFPKKEKNIRLEKYTETIAASLIKKHLILRAVVCKINEVEHMLEKVDRESYYDFAFLLEGSEIYISL